MHSMPPGLKPRNFVDVRGRANAFKALPKIVDLQKRKVLVVPLRRIITVGVFILGIFLFFLAQWPLASVFVMAPTGNAIFAAENDAERQALEAQLAGLEKQIAEYESTVSSYKKQGTTLKSEIDRLNKKIAQVNLQIKAVTLTIVQLNRNITSTENDIHTTEGDINDTKGVISKLLQNMYESEERNAIQILLEHPTLSDFFGNLNNMVMVQDGLRVELQKITNLRDQLVDKKESLSLQKNDAEALKAYQDSQRVTIQKTKGDKDSLLVVTKGQESKYQELLTVTKKTAAEIRSRIYRLLGGGELPFGEAVKIAKTAGNATGARAALILAVLTQESSVDGVIGANLGKCYYNDPRSNPSGTVMSNKQKPVFLVLMSELGLDPAKTPVSCPIVSDGAYGGAMGPAQFMPTSWDLYKDGVSAITGAKPANPFNNLDAFTATSLYLKDGLVGCRSEFSSIFSQEACAAAKYYAGGNWRSYTRVGRYGYRVAERAQNFEADIEVLDSN